MCVDNDKHIHPSHRVVMQHPDQKQQMYKDLSKYAPFLPRPEITNQAVFRDVQDNPMELYRGQNIQYIADLPLHKFLFSRIPDA